MDPCFEWWCYMRYLDVLLGVVEFEDEFFLRGVECNIPKTFLEQKLIYGAWMWERVVGRWMERQESSGASVLFSHKTLGGHPFSLHPHSWSPPSPPFCPWLAAPSPPMAAAHHFFLLPRSPAPPRSKDREEEEQDGLKRKRGSRRCSTPHLLHIFLGKP